MRLTSCDKCGVVLDLDKLNLPLSMYDEFGAIIDENAYWNGERFVKKTKCPVCGNFIPEERL